MGKEYIIMMSQMVGPPRLGRIVSCCHTTGMPMDLGEHYNSVVPKLP
ncbi:unnamed protein product [Cuscuta epithymum]|uniref:Uncharacterized protein n=1 Tax=Cuscuta epithymum TaxID=186058 RepID=A0AAV0GJ30_9ASTE|nr:unnamed protein product [Cuscuta epithymum]